MTLLKIIFIGIKVAEVATIKMLPARPTYIVFWCWSILGFPAGHAPKNKI